MKQTIDNWAFAGTCAAFVVFGIGVFAPAGSSWCGAQRCDFFGLLYGYQTMIVGFGAIVAAYYTVRATRDAAREQVTGAIAAAERQINENKRMLEQELATQRERSEQDRKRKTRAAAIAIYEGVIDLRDTAKRRRGYANGNFTGDKSLIVQLAPSFSFLRIDIPAEIHKWYADLHLFEPTPGDEILQMLAYCEQVNRRIASDGAPAVLINEFDAISSLGDLVIAELEKIRDA